MRCALPAGVTLFFFGKANDEGNNTTAMKLLRFGEPGAERPGLLDENGVIRDLSAVIADLDGPNLNAESLSKTADSDVSGFPTVSGDVRIGPCVGNVGKIVCVGRNYVEHAEESGSAVADEPVIFFKATSAISGPYDPVVIPRDSAKTDWEVELGVVIGTRASYVAEAEALDHVAGYCVVNDVSEREFQLERHGQWVKGKSCDTFAPIGPWLVTADEVPDPQRLDLWLDVNGRRCQDSNTSKMVFGVRCLVSYISHFMTLNPGDVISTGTPSGVGLGHDPPVYLKPGDVMELGVEGLGRQRQELVSHAGVVDD